MLTCARALVCDAIARDDFPPETLPASRARAAPSTWTVGGRCGRGPSDRSGWSARSRPSSGGT